MRARGAASGRSCDAGTASLLLLCILGVASCASSDGWGAASHPRGGMGAADARVSGHDDASSGLLTRLVAREVEGGRRVPMDEAVLAAVDDHTDRLVLKLDAAVGVSGGDEAALGRSLDELIASVEPAPAPEATVLKGGSALLEQGVTALDSGNVSAAVELLRRAAREEPGSAAVWSALASAAVANADVALARSALRRAYDLGDRSEFVLGRLLAFASEAGEGRRAVAYGLEMFALGVRDDGVPGALALRDLGASLAREGYQRAAAEALERAAASRTDKDGVAGARLAWRALDRDRPLLFAEAGDRFMLAGDPSRAAGAYSAGLRLVSQDGEGSEGALGTFAAADEIVIRLHAGRAWARLAVGMPGAAGADAVRALRAARFAPTPSDGVLKLLAADRSVGPALRDAIYATPGFAADKEADSVYAVLLAIRLGLPDAGERLVTEWVASPQDDRLIAAAARHAARSAPDEAAQLLGSLAAAAPWCSASLARAFVFASGELGADEERISAIATELDKQARSRPEAGGTASALGMALVQAAAPGESLPDAGVFVSMAEGAQVSGDVAGSLVALDLAVAAFVDTHDGSGLDALDRSFAGDPAGWVSISRGLLVFGAPLRSLIAARDGLAGVRDLGTVYETAAVAIALSAARAELAAERFESARVRLGVLVEARVGGPEAVALAAMAAAERGDEEGVRRYISLLVERFPGSSYAPWTRGKELIAQGRAIEAERLLVEAAVVPGAPREVAQTLGAVWRALGWPERSFVFADRARSSSPMGGEALGLWVHTLAASRGADAALRAVDDAMERGVRHPALLAASIEVAGARAFDERWVERLSAWADSMPASRAAAARHASALVAQLRTADAAKAMEPFVSPRVRGEPLTRREADTVRRLAALVVTRSISRDERDDAALSRLLALMLEHDLIAEDQRAWQAYVQTTGRSLGDDTAPLVGALVALARRFGQRSAEDQAVSIVSQLAVAARRSIEEAGLPPAQIKEHPSFGHAMSVSRDLADRFDVFPVRLVNRWMVTAYEADAVDEVLAGLRAAEEAGLFIESLGGGADPRVGRSPDEPFEVAVARVFASSVSEADFAMAERLYAVVLAAVPGDPSALNSYGYQLLERNERIEEAESMITRAYTAMPGNAAIADSLGWARYKLGVFTDERDPETGGVIRGAVPLLTHATRLAGADVSRPEDMVNLAVISYHLGDAQWRAGLREEAVASWGRAGATVRALIESGGVDGLAFDRSRAEARAVAAGVVARIEAASADQEPPLAPLGPGVIAVPTLGEASEGGDG